MAYILSHVDGLRMRNDIFPINPVGIVRLD